MMGCSVSVNMLSDDPLTFHWQLEKIFSNKFDSIYKEDNTIIDLLEDFKDDYDIKKFYTDLVNYIEDKVDYLLVYNIDYINEYFTKNRDSIKPEMVYKLSKYIINETDNTEALLNAQGIAMADAHYCDITDNMHRSAHYDELENIIKMSSLSSEKVLSFYLNFDSNLKVNNDSVADYIEQKK